MMNPKDILAMRANADRHYQQEAFENAMVLYGQLAEGNPYDSDMKLRFGYCAARLGQVSQAIASFEEALELGCKFPWHVQYEIARLYAKSGDKEACLNWLEKSLSARLEDRPAIMTDEAFASFQADQDFVRLVGGLAEADEDRVRGWRIDLDHLVKEAQRLHVSIERPAYSDPFLTTAESLRNRIPSLTDEAIVVEMQRMVAQLGDGHSQIYPWPTDKVQLAVLPVDFYLFSDGVFIIGGSGDAEQYVGNRVLQIGSRPIEAIMAEIKDFISADNAMTVKWMTPLYLILPACLQTLGATDNPTTATVTVQDRQGLIHEVELTGGAMRRPQKLWPSRISQEPPPLYLRDRETNYWLHELPELNALYVQYNQVQDMEKQSIAAFAAHLLDTVRSTRSKTLIVDVRHNNGGNNFLNWPLVRTLVHFEEDSSDNRIFVLIGRHTFSACQNFVNWIERLTGAVFVGEPTASRPNFVGESTNVVLPHSGVRASISSRVHYDSFWGDNRPWIAPQLLIELSSADYFANRDPVLETVLALIEQR